MLCACRFSAPAQCQSQNNGSRTLPVDPQAKLKLVQVVFRHGARTPLTHRYWQTWGATWPDCHGKAEAVRLAISAADGGSQPVSAHDKAQRETKLPGGCSKGELTTLGQKQAMELGQWLRQRYMQQLQYLPQQWQADAVTGRTTNFQRTIGTLQGVLTGLYPDTLEAIPVTTAADLDEVLFANVQGCLSLKLAMNAAKKKVQEQAREDARLREVDAQVRKVMDIPEGEPVVYVDLHDALTTLAAHGKHIPEGFDEDLLLTIDQEAAKRMTALVAPQAHIEGSQKLMQLSMGRLFSMLVDHMDATVQGEAQPRMLLYSGHDTTIMPLLQTLKQDVTQWPPYVSNVVLELWESPQHDTHYVRVIFNKKEVDLPDMQPGHVCTLDSLKQNFFQPFVLTAEQKEEMCRVEFGHDEPGGKGGDSVQGL